MKPEHSIPPLPFYYRQPHIHVWIQAPLPGFLDTLPILLSIEGQGSGRQGPTPLAPPEEPTND